MVTKKVIKTLNDLREVSATLFILCKQMNAFPGQRSSSEVGGKHPGTLSIGKGYCHGIPWPQRTALFPRQAPGCSLDLVPLLRKE